MSERIEKLKKRKRPQDGISKPSKRVAIESDKQVEFLLQEAGNWAPVIASTPGVALPSSIALTPYFKARRNAPHKKDTSDIATKELLLQSSDHQKLDYTAREEESGGTDALLKHYVGVYDPETGKMEAMEARKMVVRGSVRSQQATAEDRMSRNMRELRNDLGQTFGTKKAKKAIASVTENAISPDKAKRALANGGQGVKMTGADSAMLGHIGEKTKGMATRDELAKKADEGKPRPKANEDAKDVKDVYTIDNLIGSDIFKMIPAKKWLDPIKARKQIFVSNSYVGNRIGNIGENVEKIKILRYLNLLLSLHSASRRQRSNKVLPKRDEIMTILEDIPEAVFESIKRKFANGFEMSKFQVDLMITHICALACIIDNYEVDTWLLKEDLRLETKQMSQYFNEIGAKIVSLGEVERKKQGLEKAAAAQHKVAKLKIPLEFPKVSFGRKR